MEVSNASTKRPSAAVGFAADSFSGLIPVTGISIARKAASNSSLTEEQKIVHVLNRTGFGPRPGDVERVRRMGLQNYLELQLHPSKIEDSAAESKLSGLKTLTMSSSELIEQYPPRKQRKPFAGRETAWRDAEARRRRVRGNGTASGHGTERACTYHRRTGTSQAAPRCLQRTTVTTK